MTNFEKRFGRGFLPQIRRFLTISPVMLITVGLLPGLSKVMYTMNGKRGDRSCGCMGSVRLALLFCLAASNVFFINSGLREERPMVGKPVDFC
jgi:hypothetical protein